MTLELVFYLACVSVYPVISHSELAVEILLPCNIKWLYILAQCHNARSALFLTALCKVKCYNKLPNTMSKKDYTTIWFIQHDTKNGGVWCLKIFFAHLWKKHRDLHLLAEKPWGSSACSWLILLDIRHCLFKLHNVLIPPCTDSFLVLSVWICCHASSRMHIEHWSQVTLIANSIFSFGMSLLYSGCEKKKSVIFNPYLVSMFNVVGKQFVLGLDWEKLCLVSLRVRHVNILTCYIEIKAFLTGSNHQSWFSAVFSVPGAIGAGGTAQCWAGACCQTSWHARVQNANQAKLN